MIIRLNKALSSLVNVFTYPYSLNADNPSSMISSLSLIVKVFIRAFDNLLVKNFVVASKF